MHSVHTSTTSSHYKLGEYTISHITNQIIITGDLTSFKAKRGSGRGTNTKHSFTAQQTRPAGPAGVPCTVDRSWRFRGAADIVSPNELSRLSDADTIPQPTWGSVSCSLKTSLPPTTSTGGRSSCTQTVLTHSNKVCVAIHCSQTIVNNFSREMQKADFNGIFTNDLQIGTNFSFNNREYS